MVHVKMGGHEKTIESLRRKNLPSVSEGLKKASIVCGQWPFMNYLDSRLR